MSGTASGNDQSTSGQQLFAISEKRRKWFGECGANITTVIHLGQNSSVYSGQFSKDFVANQFTNRLADKRAEKYIRKDLAKCGDKFAIKCVNTENNADVRAGVEREIQVLLECCYQYIIDTYFVVKFAASDRYYLFLELADTNLETCLNQCTENRTKISEMRAKVWISSLCNAVKYLHETIICHQNISAENILVFNCGQNPQLKLADFTCAVMINPLELRNASTVTALQFDDHFNEDILDLYFVLNEILAQTSISAQSEANTVYEVINQLIRLDGDSLTLLELVLTQTNWPLNIN